MDENNDFLQGETTEPTAQPAQVPSQQPAPTPPAAQQAATIPTTGMGIAGLVLGILAVPPAFIPLMNFLTLPLAVVGIVLAAVGFSAVRKGKAKGKGIAVAGIVLNIIAIGIFILMYGTSAAVTGAAVSTAGDAASKQASTQASSQAQSTQASSQEAQVDSSESAAEEEAEYQVRITKASLAKDYSGKKAAVITYKWKNNSDKAMSFASALYPKVYQDGVQLDTAIVSGLGDSNYLKDVKPGYGTTVQLAYKLENTKDPVEVEVGPLVNLSGEVYASETFNF